MRLNDDLEPRYVIFDTELRFFPDTEHWIAACVQDQILKSSLYGLDHLDTIPALEIGGVSRIGGGKKSPLSLISSNDPKIKPVTVDTSEDINKSAHPSPLVIGDMNEANVRARILNTISNQRPKLVIAKNVLVPDSPINYGDNGLGIYDPEEDRDKNFENLCANTASLIDQNGTLVVMNSRNEEPDISGFSIVAAHELRDDPRQTIYTFRKST